MAGSAVRQIAAIAAAVAKHLTVLIVLAFQQNYW
jgi:hypothetical protein